MSHRLRSLILTVGAILAYAVPVHAAGIHLSLVPNHTLYSPNDTVFIDFVITEADAEFNTFELTAAYTPRITFLPDASTQQGPLMTGTCSTFQQFQEGPNSVHVLETLLCNNTYVRGPGIIYRLKFRAGATPGPVNLNVFDEHFFRAGVDVLPVVIQPASFCITNCVTGVGDPAAGPAVLRLEAPVPNPGAGNRTATISFTLPEPGMVALELVDVGGRRIARRSPAWFPAGVHQLGWNPGMVPPGVHFVRLRTDRGQTISRRWAFVR